MKRALPFIIILVVLAAVVAVAWSLKEAAVSNPPAPSPTSVAPPGNSASPAATVSRSVPPGAEPPNAVGPETAVVTLEEFGDFQCPPCGLLHPVLKTMKQEFGDKIRVIFREYPLVPSHPHALSAARAAEAAGLQGKFFEMHDQIFENQKAWDKAFDARPIFEGYAQKIGLDMEKYRKDLTSEVVEQRIFQDGKRAHALGVQGTPTVFMNGREIPFQSLEPGRLRTLITNEIAAAGR
ncbi:MAG TPA: thioredoxin domain-containing protein [Pyrinomonadaceae bacterium]|nr:thioredoxin domain-containing protein [Pyrinomonadaceae bacterium]